MSNSDSFIDEVSDELRSDRLYATFRKYGWIAILLVVLLVGGAAFNEWRKASARAEAQAYGDQIMAALQSESPAVRLTALDEITTEGEGAALVRFFAAADHNTAGDTAAAVEALDAIANDTALSFAYRDLAVLKSVLMQGKTTSVSSRQSILEPLATPGRPYRLLAEEQLAFIAVEQGETDAAITRLRDIIADAEVSADLRSRASQMIVALGGDLSEQ